MPQTYATATIHQFKSNIARYIRALEAGEHKAVIVKRKDTPVGLFIPYPEKDQQKLC